MGIITEETASRLAAKAETEFPNLFGGRKGADRVRLWLLNDCGLPGRLIAEGYRTDKGFTPIMLHMLVDQLIFEVFHNCTDRPPRHMLVLIARCVSRDFPTISEVGIFNTW